MRGGWGWGWLSLGSAARVHAGTTAEQLADNTGGGLAGGPCRVCPASPTTRAAQSLLCRRDSRALHLLSGPGLEVCSSAGAMPTEAANSNTGRPAHPCRLIGRGPDLEVGGQRSAVVVGLPRLGVHAAHCTGHGVQIAQSEREGLGWWDDCQVHTRFIKGYVKLQQDGRRM